ncbi:transformer-2 protein homolog alpha-like isoform X1 [Limulus polyphemus]|uniref:Transformer-2 protein homolog alpha-like isoform X1 n=1 Tax=Limulus polyphemus TaxID=6850 RepID=A0ABM1THK0_LIMPO|nr:transformer-2 protein homolog alpha-like isoform X1 [Limulus polyphemus]
MGRDSDREGSVDQQENDSQHLREKSPSPHHSPSRREERRSRSHSRTPHSRSRSRSYSRRRHSYSRSRSGSRSRKRHRRYKSRSRSRTPKHRRYSRSRSYSYSPKRSYSPRYSPRRSPYYRNRYSGYSDHDFHRSRTRSPMSSRRRHLGSRLDKDFRDNPEPCRCLGVFGLSLYTQERDLKEVFSKYGPIEQVQVVYDAQTGRSRGFAFVYFETEEDAEEAKERCNGLEIDGRKIRVDYSITKRAHTPTPGIYMGKPTFPRYGGGSSNYRGRSPSPYYRGHRYSRSRSRSYSPRLEERNKG